MSTATASAPALIDFTRPLAPAEFLCVQAGFGIVPDFELWNLTAPIPGHPTGSSVSRQTLLAAGFRVPAPVSPSPILSPASLIPASGKPL
jgi:hypothetical protein